MATYTENYRLIKAGYEDPIVYSDFNENLDVIDEQMALTEENITGINDKIGTPTGGETIFSLLKAGSSSIIKSIQRVTYSIPESSTSGSVNISEIDPNKTIVIFERLQDNFGGGIKLAYELNANSLTFEHPSYSSTNLKSTLFGFWIIEFN